VSGATIDRIQRVQSEAPDLIPEISAGRMTANEADRTRRARVRAAAVAEISAQEPG
jgi:hypothetical protein